MSTCARRPATRFDSTQRFLVLHRLIIPAAVVLSLGARLVQASEEHEGHRMSCARLTSLRFEGNTTVTAATEVNTGTLTTPTGQLLTGLPDFCRVQGLSRPSRDSHIFFEVWLPTSPWHRKFLFSGQAAHTASPTYTRLGL